MPTERSTDLILRAQVDQAIAPLAQVTQSVKSLAAALIQQGEAAKSGTTSASEYGKTLRDLQTISGDLLRQREVLNTFATRQAAVDTQQGVLDTKIAKRDELVSGLPPLADRSDKEQKSVDRLTTSIDASTRRLSTMSASLQKSVEMLTQMGVLTDELTTSQQRLDALTAAHANISTNQQVAIEALRQEKAEIGDRLILILRQGGIEKQVADQRQRDTARFLADQERERLAVIATAEATRTQGATAQRSIDAGTAHNVRQADLEAAFAADDAQKAAQRDLAASIVQLQREQSTALQGAQKLWEAEQAGAEKARLATEAFRAAVQKATTQAQAGLASATVSAGAIRPEGALPAPTLADTTRAALAGGSGPGTGTSGLAGLQSEVARISDGVKSGTIAVSAYTQELKNLDATSREVVRQSQIVDNFVKARDAATQAVDAFRLAQLELMKLEAAAKTATPETISEVTSAIAAKTKQLGSTQTGTGLAAAAQASREDLAKETAALTGIGVAMDDVGVASARLTAVAVANSQARQAIVAKEKAAFNAEADDIIARSAALSTAAVASVPSARSAISAVAGSGRGAADITDISAATDVLDKKITGAKLTAQSFNKTMDELFAVQSQIAKDATLIDNFTAQEAAVNRAKTAYAAAQTELARVSAAVKAGTADIRELRTAETSLTGAANDLSRQASLQAQVDAQLKIRKIDTTALTAETAKLVQEQQRLAAIQARTNQGNQTVFGLSSYQLQNLSFQVNDVITQLSLGQGVMRTFESQAGQIFQVFETSISAMYKMLVIALPVAAAIGLVALSLERVAETSQAQRQFAAAMVGTADGVSHSSAALVVLQRELENSGVAFADAGTAMRTLLNDGLDDTRIKQFTTTAQNMALAMGTDFTDAFKKLAPITTMSIDELEKLLLEYRALTPELAKYLEAQRAGGNIDLARSAAIDALTTHYKAAKTEAVGPLAQAWLDLKVAWHTFEDAIGSSTALTGLIHVTQGFLGLLTLTVTGLKEAKAAFESITGLKPYDYSANGDVDRLTIRLNAAKQTMEDFTKRMANGDTTNPIVERMADQVKDLQTQLDAAIAKRDSLVKGGTPGGTTGTGTGGSAADVALTHRGQGPAEVAPFLKDQNINPIVTAWCAAFANAALAQVGIQGTGSNVATSFEKWGAAVADAKDVKSGDILVQAKGNAAGAVGGHVGLATGQFKTGPDGALLVEMVSGNYGGKVATDFIPANQLDIRRATGPAGAAPNTTPNPTPLIDPTVQAATNEAKNILAQAQAQRQLDALIDSTLLGNSQARIDQDAKLAALEKIRIEDQTRAKLAGAVADTKTQALDDQMLAKFVADQAAKRDKEDAEIKQRADSAGRALDDAVAAADPTNRDAKMRAAANKSIAALDTINTLVSQGVTQIAGMPIDEFRKQILKLRDEAVNIAGTEADTASVAAAVKERDTKLSTIEGDLNKGTITLQEAFAAIAEVVAKSGPMIKAAVAKSNADLATLPQTPKVLAQLAENAKIDTTGSAAAKAVDAIAQSRLNDILTTRKNLEQEYTDQVTQGAITQSEATEKTAKAYANAKTQVNELTTAFKAQLDVQLELGQISPETYNKMISGLDKAIAKSNDLTAAQKKLGDEIDNAITSEAMTAFSTVTTAIGAAIAGTGTWSDAIKSLGTSFATFAAGVLRDIAAIILKQIVLNALQSATAGTSIGGFFAKLAGGASALGGAAGAGEAAGMASNSALSGITDVTATMAHTGAIIGAATMSRRINPQWFVGAPRAHSGAMVGLAPGEVPIIAQQGEEILAANNPRHRNNATPASGNTATSGSIRNVLLFDESELAGAMAGAHGEKVVLTHLKRNAPAVRQLLGVK